MLIQLPATVQGVKSDAKTTVRRWLKKVGEPVRAGQPLVELETDDAIFHLQAPADGVVDDVRVVAGNTVALGTTLGSFKPGDVSAPAPAKAAVVSAKPVAAAPSGMPILMPQAGNTMEEGTILKWKVAVGDTVAVGQVLCDIETDKATVEFESTDAGTISWLAPEGSVVPVKQAIAILGGSAASSSKPLPPASPGPSAPSPRPARDSSATIPTGVTPILMPQAGNTMEEGTIVQWRVKEGDMIAVGQVICDIETDKATVEMEATDAGRLAKIVAQAGAVVPVKQAMAYLAANDAAVDAYLAGGGVAAPVVVASVQQSVPVMAAATNSGAAVAHSEGGRVKASPAARKVAAQRGIDLATVSVGSGPGGRIVSTDVINLKVELQTKTSKTSAAPAAPIGPGGRRPMSKMRKAIAMNLQTSKQTVPHFYIRLTINADPMMAFYKAQKPATGCTLNDVILLAVGRLVGEFPAFRTRVDGNDLVESASANIGVAVSVADGLVVPVVMGIHSMTLAQLAPEARRVVEAARNGKIENMGKGVFTISNMGMLGVEEFAAIINPPESGILAISGVRESVIVKDGAMRAGRVMTLTLSVDHRVVDGALAAGFTARLKELLESPEKLV